MGRSLSKGDTVQLEFPVPESTDIYTIADRRFEVNVRGSTVISVKPLDGQESADVYPFYRRQNYLAQKAPMHRVQRFVADNVIPLGSF